MVPELDRVKANDSAKMTQICRFCSAPLHNTFCNLGSMPSANAYLTDRDQKESTFPLHAYICSLCFLVQLGQFQTPDEMFKNYLYFSSYAKSWVEHARQYTEMVVSRFQLDQKSFVVEIASNDGYLLQHFQKKNIPHLGIEPAENIARIAQEKGIDTWPQFFGLKLAQDLVIRKRRADLIIANNVLAHVPDLNGFVAGLKTLLAPEGVITLEFPHLQRLISENQFDTIYHEHFCYFSLFSVEKVFAKHGLEVFDVESLLTHGGSLRVYLQHRGGKINKSVAQLKNEEMIQGVNRIESYLSFSSQIERIKKDLVAFLVKIKETGKRIAGYGAPAKGNTLLNYCGITPELLPFTVDLNPHKQKHFLPGTRIPIQAPEKIYEYKPDYLLVLPWNLKSEIMHQMGAIRDWGGQFLFAIPQLKVEK